VSPRSTDYALLSQDVYHDTEKNKTVTLDGITYRVIDTANNANTGFQAQAYERMDVRPHQVIIAYRGTEFDREPVHDGGVDAGMVLAGVNLQTADSTRFAEKVIAEANQLAKDEGRQPPEITVTGHSLGGTLAEINAARFGLKGETFNAYGAAGLMEGIPTGGTQVIDHVRAGDVVSAASEHFGEVRVYAAQKDIDTLSHAEYRDDGGILSIRNPVKAIDFDAHSIDNFVPDSKLLGHSIMSPENEARYRAHEGMIDRYRNDVMDIRRGLSASWEIPKAIGKAGQQLGHEVGEGAQAVGHAVSHVAHEVADTVGHLRDEVSTDIHAASHAVSDGASRAWNTVLHPSTLFLNSDPVPVRIDHPGHPDHPMFQQARDGVRQIDTQHQRTPDERSDRLAASLVVAARETGLQQIHQVLLNSDASRTYAVQGEPNSPLKRVAEVDTMQAMSTSLEQSSLALEQVGQRNQMHAQTAQQQQHQQTQQQGPASSGI
jgi:fermentation-respiration switch protein FrsA (DUF1100 family)